MEKNLIGYLLNCLDEPTQREVEAYLAADSDGREKLAKLRCALEPLEADREPAAPPGDLVYRTLGRVAEFCSQTLPRAPATTRASGGERPFWRRADVVAAAAVILLAIGVGIPALFRLRDQSNVECQENLRVFHTGLKSYHDLKRHYPNVQAEAPHNAAGMMVPILIDAGVLDPEASVRCPGNGPGKPCPHTYAQLKKMSREEFRKHARSLASCYAYSLGHRDERGYHPPTFNPEQASRLPLMSDRPPYDADSEANSPNHAGKGQNILFQDGHVEFLTKRSLPFDNDIFKNHKGNAAAGDREEQVILGSSDSEP